MAEIPLGGKYGIGKVALVDVEDYERVIGLSWFCDARGYPLSYSLGRHPVALQNLVMAHEPNMETVVDHINGNPLDNRRDNLRVIPFGHNPWNQCKKVRGRHGVPPASKYKGVSRKERCVTRPWFARICVKRKYMHLGSFATEEEAARAYDRAARQYFGELARPNFND